jgi:hypothetical protein
MSDNLTIAETVKLMQQDEELKTRGENAIWYGVRDRGER